MDDEYKPLYGFFLTAVIIAMAGLLTSDCSNKRMNAILAGCIERGYAPEECKKAVK